MLKLIFPAAFGALLATSPAGAMTYRQVAFQDGSVALTAQGRVEEDEAAQFVSALRVALSQGVAPQRLIVSSPGGNIGGALELGILVRTLGIKTIVGKIADATDGSRSLVSAGCASACVYVLMAGTDRSITPGSRVWVHTPRLILDVDEGTHRLVERWMEPRLRRYAAAMGVSPEVITATFAVPNSSARLLSSSELSKYRLVGSGSGTKATRKSAGKARTSATRQQRQVRAGAS